MLHQLLDIFRHLDTHLATLKTEHGAWVYAVLFAIIFAETGLVVLPFLPGDSLLFTVGALAARNIGLDFWTAFALLIVAGVLGDFVNYHAGKFIGPRVFCKGDACATGVKPTLLERMLNKKHLERTNEFFAKYGGKAVVLGRFVPIVRTFVPFVAGAGAMEYRRFIIFNIAGAVLWIGVCMGAGFFFGNMEVVKKNFELVVVGIIIVSVLPMVFEFVLARRRAAKAAVATGVS